MKNTNRPLGILFMLLAVIAFSLMTVGVKVLSDIPTQVISFYRFVTGIAVLGIMASFNKIKLRFNNMWLLFIRGAIGGYNVYLFYLIITKLGIGVGTVIGYSYPIFAALLSFIFLKEKIPVLKWVFIGTAFAGLYIMVGGLDISTVGKYELIALASAIISGIIIVMVKKLHKTDDSYAMFFSQSLWGLMIFFIPSTTAIVHFEISIGLIMLGIGIMAAIGQLFMTESYFHISVSTGAPLILLVPVANLILGHYVFHEPMTTIQVISSAVILISCIAVTRIK